MKNGKHGWFGNTQKHAQAAMEGWKKRWQRSLDIILEKESKNQARAKDFELKEKLQNKIAGIKIVEKKVQAKKGGNSPIQTVNVIYSPEYLEKIKQELDEKIKPQIALIQIPEKKFIQAEQNIEDKIRELEIREEEIRKLLKETEINFYKRRISEKEFRDRFYDLRLELAKITAEKRIWIEKKQKKESTENEKQPASAVSKPSMEWINGLRAVQQQINPEKLQILQEKLEKLAKKYGITSAEIEHDVQKLGVQKIVQDYQSLLELIQTEHEQTLKKLDNKEKVVYILKEIQKHKVLTQLDQLLDYVNQQEKTSEKEAAKKLNESLQSVREYAEILEQNMLLAIHYPPLGEIEYWSIEYQKKSKLNPKSINTSKNRK
ncbi:MAG: hypothetical protein Q7S92_02155 [Candidatus Diapherotrites archaeon]|nr:hypothetical protein [Candidatus Diapherotrites archaeon]